MRTSVFLSIDIPLSLTFQSCASAEL